MVAKIEADQSSQCSHLFMLRLWLEDLGNGQTDWRGKVQHVNSGEARYFRDWSTLEAFMEGQMHQPRKEIRRMGSRKPIGILDDHNWNPGARRPLRYD
jgi:hypothetical protein